MNSRTVRVVLVLALAALIVAAVALSGCSKPASTTTNTTPGATSTGTPEGNEAPNVQGAPGEEQAPVESSSTSVP